MSLRILSIVANPEHPDPVISTNGSKFKECCFKQEYNKTVIKPEASFSYFGLAGLILLSSFKNIDRILELVQ